MLRHYNTIQDTFKWNKFLTVCYLKCLDFINPIMRVMSKLEGYNDKIKYGKNTILN